MPAFLSLIAHRHSAGDERLSAPVALAIIHQQLARLSELEHQHHTATRTLHQVALLLTQHGYDSQVRASLSRRRVLSWACVNTFIRFFGAFFVLKSTLFYSFICVGAVGGGSQSGARAIG